MGSAKGWITRYLKALEVSHLAGNLDAKVFTTQNEKLDIQIDKLMNFDSDIGDIYRKHQALNELVMP